MHIHHSSSGAGLVAAALVLVAATACTPEGAAPGETASSVNRVSAEAAESDPADVGAEKGTARLPEGFPADFPLPPDFTVTSGQFTEGSFATQANFLVRGTSTSSVTEIATFYHDRLPQAGYKVQQFQPVVPEMTKARVLFHGDAFKNCSIQLTKANGSTNVMISLPLRD